jgi:hypothetical protein
VGIDKEDNDQTEAEEIKKPDWLLDYFDFEGCEE